jgi:hypothetical protein
MPVSVYCTVLYICNKRRKAESFLLEFPHGKGRSFCTMPRVLVLHSRRVFILDYVKGAHCALPGGCSFALCEGCSFCTCGTATHFSLLGCHFAQGGGCSVGTVWMVFIFNRWAGYSFFILWRAPILYSLEVLIFHCARFHRARFLSGEWSVFPVWRVFILHCLERAFFALCKDAHFSLS